MKPIRKLSDLCVAAGLVTLVFMICAAAQFARAQQTTAEILGSVTDQSGAVVPNATVTVTNLATRITRVTTSTGAGDYVVNLLNPGTYSVVVTARGFQKFAVPSVTLAAGDRTLVNARMAVGNASQTVTVSGVTTGLDTSSATLTSNIGQQPTQDLPLNGRNFVQLLQLTPGVNEGPATSLIGGNGSIDDNRQSASYSVNGQQEMLNNNMIDGADNLEKLIGSIAVRPSIDSIAETSVQTNTYSAEVGRTGGGIVNVITKSGTNQFHGDAFEFLRNDIFNTNNFNFGSHLPKGEWRQNQYGGSLGGPVIRDRLFFFASYEGYRLVQGVAPSVLVVPTDYEYKSIHNYMTNPSAGIDFTDAGGPVVPQSAVDTAGEDYLLMFPAPNTGSNEYVSGYNQLQYSTVADGRVDYTFNPENTIYGRWIYNSVYSNSGNGAFPKATIGGVSLYPKAGNWEQDNDYDALLNYIHIFTPRMVLNLKASYTRTRDQGYPGTLGLNPNTAIGQPGINTNFANSDATCLVEISVTAGTTMGCGGFIPVLDEDGTWEYMGDVTYTRGSHNINMGAGLIRRQLTSFQSSSPEGTWKFSTYYDLAEGAFFSNNGRSLELDDPHLRTWEPDVYVQDDWRIRPSLTLNLGLRYGIFTPDTEIDNRISTWNPVTETLQIAGQNGVSATAGIQTDYHGLAPRFGFAWDLGHNFVVHGGYGIGYFPANETSNANLKNPPFVATAVACNTPGQGGAPCTAPYTNFADGMALPAPASITAPGATIPDAVAPNWRTSYIQQFNLTVEKELRGNVLSIGYVGLIGRQLDQLLEDLNVPPPNNCATAPVTVPSCYQQLRPYFAKYPNLGAVGYFQTGGSSSYNALEASVERRMDNGLAFNLNGYWAHNLDNATSLSFENTTGGFGDVPSIADKRDYGNSALNDPWRFAATADYQLPFAKNATGFRGVVAKGWQANLIEVWTAGTPFTVLNATNISDTAENGATSTDRPNQVSGWALSNPSIHEFFNTKAFQPQAEGTLGNEARWAEGGPHWRHLDISLFKTFPIWERDTLEFRVEGYNVTNTTNFAEPNSTINGATYGEITSTARTYIPRVLQFALKFNF